LIDLIIYLWVMGQSITGTDHPPDPSRFIDHLTLDPLTHFQLWQVDIDEY